MRDVLEIIADKGSVLDIRPKFGVGIITALIRVEGRPMGVIANNPHHLAGAVDSPGADKGARFLQLCDAFDIPILSLIDCPGIMVGPEVERTALVRHCTRLFNVGANITTPLFSVVVRKAYGLGAQAMLGAGSLVGFFSIAWPTAEFAGMNIEGAVKLGYRKELMAIDEPEARREEFDRRTAIAYDNAKAVNAVTGGGIDDVIDPADTRRWIVNSLRRLPPVLPRTEKKYPISTLGDRDRMGSSSVLPPNRNPHYPIARPTMSRAVSRLISGQHTMKISVPWTVPMTWRQRACTPFRIRNR